MPAKSSLLKIVFFNSSDSSQRFHILLGSVECNGEAFKLPLYRPIDAQFVDTGALVCDSEEPPQAQVLLSDAAISLVAITLSTALFIHSYSVCIWLRYDVGILA